MGQKILDCVINTVQYMWHISFIFLKIPEMCTPLLPYYGGALQKPLAFLPLHLNSYCPEHLFNEKNPKQIKPCSHMYLCHNENSKICPSSVQPSLSYLSQSTCNGTWRYENQALPMTFFV